MFSLQEHMNHDMTLDPQVDRDVIAGIEDVYYEDGTFDPGLHELQVCGIHYINDPDYMNSGSVWYSLYKQSGLHELQVCGIHYLWCGINSLPPA